jgi:hypothetical protein
LATTAAVAMLDAGKRPEGYAARLRNDRNHPRWYSLAELGSRYLHEG